MRVAAQPAPSSLLQRARAMARRQRHGDAARLLTVALAAPGLPPEVERQARRQRAEAWLGMGMERRAWADLQALARLVPDDPWHRLQSARLRGRHGDATGPLSEALAIARARPTLTLAWRVAEELAGDASRLGLHAEIAIGRAMAAPADLDATLRAVPVLSQRGQPDGALALLDRAASAHPHAGRRLDPARARVLLGARRLHALSDLLPRLHAPDPAAARWLSRAWLIVGEPWRAWELLDAARPPQPGPEHAAWRLAMVELCCRCGWLERAATAAGSAPAGVNGDGVLDDAGLVLTAARGDWTTVAGMADRPWVRLGSRVLVAEALRRAGRRAAARRHLERAQIESHTPPPGLLLNRLMLEAQPYLADACVELFRPMLPARPPRASWERIAWLRRRGDGLLDRLGGVRDELLTWSTSTAIAVHWPRKDLRSELASLRQSMVALGMDGTIARYDALERAHGPDPYICTYRGELRLWAGDREGARADLARALQMDDRIRWAYVGRALLQLLDGDLQGALCGLDRAEAAVGPLSSATPVRAEAHLLLGAPSRAEDQAIEALRHRPARVSSWLVLALARLRRGHRDDDIIDAFARLFPELWAVCAGDDVAARLSDALRHMQGNRASGLITWRDPRGWWMARPARALLPVRDLRHRRA